MVHCSDLTYLAGVLSYIRDLARIRDLTHTRDLTLIRVLIYFNN